MTTLINKYKQISKLQPTRRGTQFERLLYEVFERENILLERSYFNDDGSQQIDGAVEVNNRIFITEIKWEKSKTLAASKLYSFLGKINSKIDGTLGLFISNNELSNNFINSVRAGVKQNCIIINGRENIVSIIKGDILLKDYIWYIYQQASTRNIIYIPVSEFMSLPEKATVRKDDSKWQEVYESLISDEDNGDFEVKLESNYGQIDMLPKKTITLYPILRKNRIIINKLHFLVDTIIDKDPKTFYHSLVEKLKSLHWLKYADESLLTKTKKISRLDQKQGDKIALKAIEYLREHYGQWEEENSASLVLDFLLDQLSDNAIREIHCAYAAIYCDTSRKNHYPQKQFADKIFSSLSGKEKFKAVKKEIIEFISNLKEEERIFSEDTEDKNRKYVIRRATQRFEKIIEEANFKNVNTKLVKIYDDTKQINSDANSATLHLRLLFAG